MYGGKLFLVRVMKQRSKLPRQVVESPSLTVLTNQQRLGATEGNFGVSPALSRELDEVTFSGPFPPKWLSNSKTSNSENLNYRKYIC